MNHFNTILKVSTLALAVASGLAFGQPGTPPTGQNLDQPIGFAAKTEREVFYANSTGTGAGVATALASRASDSEVPLGFAARTQREIYDANGSASGTGLTRAQVRAEMLAARNAGELPVGFAALSERDRFGAVAPRAEAPRHLAGATVTQTR